MEPAIEWDQVVYPLDEEETFGQREGQQSRSEDVPVDRIKQVCCQMVSLNKIVTLSLKGRNTPELSRDMMRNATLVDGESNLAGREEGSKR